MSSIRPLVTITILVAVGVFLFMKINEGPAPLPAEMDDALERAPAANVPPLATATTPPTAPTTIPSWSDPPSGASQRMAATPPVNVPPASSLSTASADLPPIPELPPLSPAPLSPAPEAHAVTTPAPSETVPIPLPANIPVAQYPSDAATVPPSNVAGMQTPTYAANNTTPQSQAAEAVSSSAPTTPQTASDDRYGMMQAEPSAMAATAPPAAPPMQTQMPTQTPTFAADWPEIKAALERQELVAAHEMLSRWYGNPSLTPAESRQVELLLSQLAGTVVYSNEHRLEPPYTVHAGDTLQTIAQRYDVPWQLLAKINGIPAADMVQPGQQLKVIHGPFAAVVELDKRQLTLILDGRYAGRFPISVAPDVGVNEGQWVLEQKLVQPTTQSSGVVSASYATTAVDHVLVLRNESPTAGGATVSITAGPGAPSGPTAIAPSAIRLSPRDVEEVADILSVGSPVTIRR